MTSAGTYAAQDFPGGVHPPEHKDPAANKAIETAPILEKYHVILQQHIGAPPGLLVEKGDVVKKGQLLAESGGFVSARIHSPTSGKVEDIAEHPGPAGVPIPSVEITSDGEDTPSGELEPISDWRNADPNLLLDRIRDAGIVGMGGAAFPSSVKLSPPENKKVDTLILNGAECEPYLTADYRLMLEDPGNVVAGAGIMARILGVDNICICVEDNKPDAVETLRNESADIPVQSLKTMYPQGAEKQLIYTLTGRKVPRGGLPMDIGCVVHNVGTAAAVAAAVLEGTPLTERVTTVTGTPVANPGNWKLRIGTPISKALELAGGIKSDTAKIILGGPMMGLAQSSLEVPVMKSTSGILLLAPGEISQFRSMPCIRCGRCVDACPMNLMPGTLSVMIESEFYDLAEEKYLMDCIECGCCAYLCPSNRPLVQHFKRAKSEITAKRNKENKAS